MPLRLLVAAGIFTLAPSLVSPVLTGCSDDEATHDQVAGLEDVVYEGGATDEALNALIGAPVKAGKTVTFTAPAAGASVKTGDAAFTLTWDALAKASASFWKSAFEPKVAHAHGAALFGNGYYLQFTRDGQSILSVFTANTSYTPTVSAWQKLVTGNVSVTLTAALFDNNNVARDGGPYLSSPVAFTITP